MFVEITVVCVCVHVCVCVSAKEKFLISHLWTIGYNSTLPKLQVAASFPVRTKDSSLNWKLDDPWDVGGLRNFPPPQPKSAQCFCVFWSHRPTFSAWCRLSLALLQADIILQNTVISGLGDQWWLATSLLEFLADGLLWIGENCQNHGKLSICRKSTRDEGNGNEMMFEWKGFICIS